MVTWSSWSRDFDGHMDLDVMGGCFAPPAPRPPWGREWDVPLGPAVMCLGARVALDPRGPRGDVLV